MPEIDSRCAAALDKTGCRLTESARAMAQQMEEFGAHEAKFTLEFLKEDEDADADFIATLTVTVTRV